MTSNSPPCPGCTGSSPAGCTPHWTTRHRSSTRTPTTVESTPDSSRCRENSPSTEPGAVHSDIDHRLDHAKGGPTTEANLGPCCRYHHGLKTDGGWRLIQRAEGTRVWISPLGRRHESPID